MGTALTWLGHGSWSIGTGGHAVLLAMKMGSGLILSEDDLTRPMRVGQNETRPHFPTLANRACSKSPPASLGMNAVTTSGV